MLRFMQPKREPMDNTDFSKKNCSTAHPVMCKEKEINIQSNFF